jgi:uncharacterized peroxidase-related enzyme
MVTDPVASRVYGEIESELGFGIVPNVFRAMASCPPFLEANWNAFRATVLHGTLPRLVKEMIGVVVSTVHNSDYARLVHLHSLGLQGVADDVLEALSSGKTEYPSLSPSTVAVLRFSQKAAQDAGSIGDADLKSLTDAGLTSDEIFEVLATIQIFSAVNLFTDVAAVELDKIS